MIKKIIFLYFFFVYYSLESQGSFQDIAATLMPHSGYRYRGRTQKQMTDNHPNLPHIFNSSQIVSGIVINGLEHIPVQAILGKIPFRVGDTLDAKKAALIVKNLYYMGYFSDVKLYLEKQENNSIRLHIKIKEKRKLGKFIWQGNHNLSEESLEKTLHISKINWIDEFSIRVLIEKLQKKYKEKQYNHVQVNYEFIYLENGLVDVKIIINEGICNKIKSIGFKGNKKISRFELKNILVSRENWILGFLDRGGVYRKEMIEFDKYQIESFYRTKGFFKAIVSNVTIEENENDGMMNITFYIDEGDIYTFNKINLKNNSELSEKKLKKIINIKPGELYNQDKIKYITQNIKDELSDLGYMYSQVNPKMKIWPEDKTIDIEFIIEQGKPIYTRNILLRGNAVTHDNVIRREINFNEGEILSAKKLAQSKQAIEGLGFFKPNTGVSWDIENFDKYQSNVYLFLEEAKTGRFYLNLSINNGSDAGKNEQALDQAVGARWYDTLITVSRIGLTVQDSNWNGKGIRYFIDGSYANRDRSLTCGMSTPWFFDYPISAGWNISFRNLIYSQFQQTVETPNENNQSANVQFGYRCAPLAMTLFAFSSGIDNIAYRNSIIPLIKFPDNPIYQSAYNQIVIRSFQPGTITWVNFAISNDKRNHPTRASNGYKLILESKMALPNQTLFKNISNFGYIRIGAEADWYTPLIIEYDVILRLHGYAGYIYKLPNCNIPYKELFHIGGPQNVRGYLYGQIGPMLMGSSLGATKSFFINAEIRCPITQLNGMMALVFYDGGAGWDTIYNDVTNTKTNTEITIDNNVDAFFYYNPNQLLIQNNSFQYRHAVGIGVRLTSPMPIKIDWGIKLDRNKKLGESLSEVHIAMEGEY